MTIPTISTSPTGMSASEPKVTQQRWIGPIAFITGLVSIGIFLSFMLQAFQRPVWQIFTLAASFALLLLLSAFVYRGLWTSDINIRVLTLLIGFYIAMIFFSALVTQIGVLLAIIVVIFTIIVASTTLQDQFADNVILAGLTIGMICALIGSFSPFKQIELPGLELYTPAILGAVVMIYVVLMLLEFVAATIKIKLITVALAMVLFPLILLSYLETSFLQTAFQSQSEQALQLSADQVARRVDDFINSNLSQIEKQASLPVFSKFLEMTPDKRRNSPEENEIISVFKSFEIGQKANNPSYAILNSFGVNTFDSNPLFKGTAEGIEPYFNEAFVTGQPYVSQVIFVWNAPYIYFSAPIRNSRQQVIGVLRVRYDALALQNILKEYVGIIGPRSYPLLLDENMFRIADTINPSQLFRSVGPLSQTFLSSLRITKRLNTDINPAEVSSPVPDLEQGIKNYSITPFFSAEMHRTSTHVEAGAISRLSSRPWYLVYMQETTSQLELSKSQQRLSITISTILAGLVGLIAAFSSGLFSRPILQLASVAQKISSGDLSAKAEVDSEDEIGTLGKTFNIMTGQLRSFITDLEDRVQDRTKELALQNEALAFRARQLQTVSDVARGVTSTQSIEALLTRVTDLISERFGFYHVGIFLVDTNNEYAILRAANSEGGKRMLARAHKLKVGQVGIVGYATGKGLPRIATDVGEDSVYFNNPDLPLTRSEMALPLKIGANIIGALDVQSTQSNAFSQEDIELFSILSDQISIAIQNNQLFEDTRKALEESQNLHKQYLRQEWTLDLAERKHTQYAYSELGISTADFRDIPEIEHVIDSGQPIVENFGNETNARSVMALPIMLRGETIGVIHIQDDGQAREWSEDEILSVQSVADQVAFALENARLFEQTVRRAERERRVLEITSKIRSTTDPQQMLHIAVEELKNSLKASRAQILVQVPEEILGETNTINGNGHNPLPDPDGNTNE